MIYFLSILAAFVCALCDGVAAVLQKVSVDKEPVAGSMSVSFLRRIFRDWPFLLGSALDILGAVVIVAAVYYLPLFLAEAIIATSIIITALIEHFYMHRKLQAKLYGYIGIMFIGIVFLAIAASPERPGHISAMTSWILLIAPLPLFALGLGLTKLPGYTAGVWLAILSGIEFGLTTIVSRIIHFYQPWWHNIYNPYFFSIIAGGACGISLFAVALQRSHATITNAALTSTKIMAPTIIGIALLGDKARAGLWPLVIAGLALTATAALLLTLLPEPEKTTA